MTDKWCRLRGEPVDGDRKDSALILPGLETRPLEFASNQLRPRVK